MDQVTGQSTMQPTPQTGQPTQSPPLPPAAPTVTKQSSDNYFKRLVSGRVNRRNFIIGNLLPTAILISLTFVLIFISNNGHWGITDLSIKPGQSVPDTPPVSPLVRIFDIIAILACILVTIYVLIYTFSLMIRRLHDLGKTGWLGLLTFIPFVSTLFGIYITFFPGTKGENNYGSQPLPRINIKQDILRF